MNFKDVVARDIKTVFHNSNEFAETQTVVYNGKEYTIPVILDHTEATERKKTIHDNAEGIFKVDAVAYIAHEDIKTIPRKDRQIEIGTGDCLELYNIVGVQYEDGEIILDLEMMDE
jgi:hypothetical protein